MQYKEILELYGYFHPVYDITQESGEYWKQFIPTKGFLDVLKSVLNSLELQEKKKRKSIWIQGAYGTGKSHATGVIKHLLSDDWDKIKDFVEKLNDSDLKRRLENFRKENRIFPVILKGVSGINSPKDFSLAIEKAVKRGLEHLHLNIIVQSEFEKYLKYLEDGKINWQNLINNHPKLKNIVSDVKGLKKRLEQKDLEIIPMIDEALGDLKISHPNIEEWLSEVQKELQKHGFSYIVIYWDEFTPIMELSISSVLLNVLQNIAEKSFNENIFLFIISHRTPQQTQIPKEDQEKLYGRFEIKRYEMEDITTFHIISNAIKIKNKEIWEKLRNPSLKNIHFERIVNKISGNNYNIGNTLKDLFPIHPFTAHLAVGIARYIGSTERSIFNFLYDEKKGFKYFIHHYPNLEKNQYFLTADHLWDYFLEELERRQEERIINIVYKFKSHQSSLQEQGEEYLAIFKLILLMNLLTLYITTEEESLFTPNENNIKYAFVGTHYEDSLAKVLDYIDKRILAKTPDGLYHISHINLPQEKVSIEIAKVKNRYEDITKYIQKYKNTIRVINEFENQITKRVLRQTQILMLWAGSSESEIRSNLLTQMNKQKYQIKIALFLAKTQEEINNIKRILDKFYEKDFENIIFVVSNVPLGEETEKFYEYVARSNVAVEYSYSDESRRYDDHSKKILEDWFDKIQRDYIDVFFRGSNERMPLLQLGDRINQFYSQEIFSYGLEKIIQNGVLWEPKNAEKTAEKFFEEKREVLEQRLNKKPEMELLKLFKNRMDEYIIDKDLNFMDNVDINHPTYKICKEVKEALMQQEGHSFHLGETLEFLKEPPYGFYPNTIHYALLAFALRPFMKRLYDDSNTGEKLTSLGMKQKIGNLFKFWTEEKDSNQLNVRLGTKEEGLLTKILINIFGLPEVENLSKVKLHINHWIEEIQLPFWGLKYVPSVKEDLKEFINFIDEFIKKQEKEFSEKDIRKVLDLIKKNETDIKLLVQKENLKKGFYNWIKIKNFTITESEIQELKNHLFNNIQQEISLWQEDVVTFEIEKWQLKQQQEKYKINFINSIKELFHLQDNIQDYSELKEALKDFINHGLNYPLWTIKYVFSNMANLHNFIDFIQNFVKNDKEPFREQIEQQLKIIDTQKTLLRTSLNSEIAKQGLIGWLKLNKKNIEESSIDSLISITRNNFKKELYDYEEKELLDYATLFEFQQLLAKLFNIDIDSNKTLQDLKSRIKRIVAEKMYPFWAIGLEEGLDHTIEKIADYIVSDREYNNKEIENLYSLTNQNFDRIISTWTSKVDVLYQNWLKEILELDAEVTQLINDIKRKIDNEEHYYWKKDKVENWVRRNKEGLIKQVITKDKKQSIIEKIKETDKDLKEVMIKILEEYPQIIAKLEKLL